MNLPDMEQIDEQLTAYLDGELSPAEAGALERNLVDDERLRIRLAELRQSYDLLDEVPETPHNQRFTKSTLELVIKDLSATPKQSPSGQTAVSTKPITKPRNKPAWPAFLGLIGVCAVTGAVFACVVAMIETRRQLQELGLVAGIHGLRDVNEVNIAVKLSQEKELMAVLRQHFDDKLVPAPPDSIGQRKSWVQSLTQKQVSRLDDGREKVGKLSREERTRLAASKMKSNNFRPPPNPGGRESHRARIGWISSSRPKRNGLHEIGATVRVLARATVSEMRQVLC